MIMEDGSVSNYPGGDKIELAIDINLMEMGHAAWAHTFQHIFACTKVSMINSCTDQLTVILNMLNQEEDDVIHPVTCNWELR